MVVHEKSMYERLHTLGIVRYGYVPDALTRIIKEGLWKVWCDETMRPDLYSEWSIEHDPAMGQSDVTAYYLAKHVFNGSLIEVNLRGMP